MVVAKESVAALYHSDEYSAYTLLLATNSTELTSIISRVYGNTAALDFAQVWNAQNEFLIDYAIGVVTHDDDKAKTAIAQLKDSFTPHFANVLEKLTRVPNSLYAQLIEEQEVLNKAFIDALVAGDFTTFYLQLNYAYFWSERLGDVLVQVIVPAFPDKFPGDPLSTAVQSRVSVNVVLQQHAYLVTMATDATINGRVYDRAGALVALGTNGNSIRTEIEDPRFALVWLKEYHALVDYAAKGDDASRNVITNTLVAELASVTRQASSIIANHENATIKVLDDQRSKSKSIADDDRAAATSMQPIADSIQG